MLIFNVKFFYNFKNGVLLKRVKKILLVALNSFVALSSSQKREKIKASVLLGSSLGDLSSQDMSRYGSQNVWMIKSSSPNKNGGLGKINGIYYMMIKINSQRKSPKFSENLK